ncbi:MAG: hypothetical protein ACOCZV_00265 [Nanoarchaeota archaeon]
MTDENQAIHDEERAEKRFIRHLQRELKEARRIYRTTHKEERAIESHDQDKELKFDKREEKEMTILLHDMILSFRDLIRIIRDQGKVEEAEGKRAVKIHDEYKGKIESELGYLMKELRILRTSENKE